MKKVFNWCKDNILFLFTLFLLVFIPLYPKLPLINVRNVWVYVRLEDFVVLFMLCWWMVLVFRKSLPLRTPLTLPILVFWLVGAVTTVHGIILVFPDLANVFPNVAFLSYLRHIEYMSLFFIGYNGMKEKRFFLPFVIVLIASLCLVLGYGIGQKYFSFPAFLTMNEQFAKGAPIYLSSLSRVSSTFGGQYDLAAYLVLLLPIMVSLVFGYKNWIVKVMLLGVTAVGLLVLFMTVSRISLFALFIALGVVIFMHRKKLVLVSIPVLLVVIGILFVVSPSLLARYGNTIKEIDVLVDTKTGEPIGQVKDEPQVYFEHKVVKQEFFSSISSVFTSSPSASLVIPNHLMPLHAVLIEESDVPTGENLPQGTGYINLSLSPVEKRLGNFYFERKPDPKNGQVIVTIINGDYLLKRAAAYDLSFTTRFQGEWPRAIEAFKRNVLFGSGYGSVSLAVDNNYLRMLAEVGALGFISFLTIFIVLEIYVRKALPSIDSRPAKSFIIGLSAGIAGLAVNALFIDVFEASKIAFILWLLMGAMVSLMHFYHKGTGDYVRELKKIATSTGAIIVYLGIVAVLLYSLMLRNYFVGDDFTWFRWVAGARMVPSTILKYFTSADGFFYRPGAKLYFLLMYSVFWLNQVPYHIVSLTLHFIMSVLVFLLTKKIMKSTVISVAAGFLFLILSGLSEAVFWISATGFLFTACFSIAGLLCYIEWVEKKKTAYFVAALCFSILSPLFHELGIVTPLLFLVYRWTMGRKTPEKILFLPIPLYLIVRFFAHSQWLSGDYNYNLLKLPFNVAGNAIGYVSLTLFGPFSLPVYEQFRTLLREHAALASVLVAVALILLIFACRKMSKFLNKEEMSIFLFGACFFLVAQAPFLGLGNITSRYSYLGSIGVLFLFMLFLKKFAAYLAPIGRDIAVVSTIIVVSVFSLLHIVELQQIHDNWYEAGQITQRFFVSIDSEYNDLWATEPVEFHFVNVPIRYGEAWVFPVGLPDALWLVYHNPKLKIYTWPSVTEAFQAVPYGSLTQKIFVFDDAGYVTLVKRPLKIQ